MGNTGISYATKGWNPIVGCPRPIVSPGCAKCWARELHDMRHRAFLAGKMMPAQYSRPFDELQFLPDRISEPFTWKKAQRVFVAPQSDLFHAAVSSEIIAAAFGVMSATPRHTYLTLTKRPERMLEWVEWYEREEAAHGGVLHGNWGAYAPHDEDDDDSVDQAILDADWPLPNVLLGATVTFQDEADRIIPILCQLSEQGWRTWLSVEPMLGPVDLRAGLRGGKRPFAFKCDECDFGGVDLGGTDCVAHRKKFPSLDWVVVGCDSAKNARSMDPEWARSVLRQCSAAGVHCFVKQLNSSTRGAVLTDPERFPLDLRVRELPETRARDCFYLDL